MAKTDPIAELNARVKTLEAVLKIDQWMAVNEAATILGVKPCWIRTRIQRAEERATAKQPVTLKYGTHYRDIGESRSQWQVSIGAMRQYLELRANERYEG